MTSDSYFTTRKAFQLVLSLSSPSCLLLGLSVEFALNFETRALRMAELLLFLTVASSDRKWPSLGISSDGILTRVRLSDSMSAGAGGAEVTGLVEANAALN